MSESAEKGEGMTPEQRVMRSRMGAYALHATHDSKETTKAAQHASQVLRFERQVDPDSTLPQEERTRRALAARRAYMAGLSLKRSRTAQGKREGAKKTAKHDTH